MIGLAPLVRARERAGCIPVQAVLLWSATCDVTGRWDPSRPEPCVLPVSEWPEPRRDVTWERIRVGLSPVGYRYSESAQADQEGGESGDQVASDRPGPPRVPGGVKRFDRVKGRGPP
jgi:hypothetical protein